MRGTDIPELDEDELDLICLLIATRHQVTAIYSIISIQIQLFSNFDQGCALSVVLINYLLNRRRCCIHLRIVYSSWYLTRIRIH